MKKVYPKEEVCMACRLCEVHCLAAHSLSQDLIRAYKLESPRPRALVQVTEKGPVSLALPCRHCREPMCVYGCFAGALTRDEATGVVSLDPEKCVGCWTCLAVCPYGAIYRDPARGVAAKCDLCAGRPQPACVANCPNEALIFAESARG